MKKVFLILSLLISVVCLGQGIPYPLNVTNGTNTTGVLTRGRLSVDSLLQINTSCFQDSASANRGRIDEIPGAMIRLCNNTILLRNNTATAWVGIGTATSITDINFITDSSVVICYSNNVCDTIAFTNNVFITNSVVNNTIHGDTLISCTTTGNITICDTLIFSGLSGDTIFNYYFLNDSTAVACGDTTIICDMDGNCTIQQVCDTLSIPKIKSIIYQNGVNSPAKGIVEHGSTGDVTSWLYKNTEINTTYKKYGVYGYPIYDYPFYVTQGQYPFIGPGIASFKNNNYLPRLGIQYVTDTILGLPTFNGFMGNRDGFVLGSNFIGSVAENPPFVYVSVDDPNAKVGGIFFNTTDVQNTEGVTLFSSGAAGTNLRLSMDTTKGLTLHTTKQLQSWGYGSTSKFIVNDTTNYKPKVLGTDGKEYRMSYWPRGAIDGIDDVLSVQQSLTANRFIDLSTKSLSIESNSGINYWQLGGSVTNPYLEYNFQNATQTSIGSVAPGVWSVGTTGPTGGNVYQSLNSFSGGNHEYQMGSSKTVAGTWLDTKTEMLNDGTAANSYWYNHRELWSGGPGISSKILQDNNGISFFTSSMIGSSNINSNYKGLRIDGNHQLFVDSMAIGGAPADSVVVITPSGQFKKRNASSFGTTYTFTNGLTEIGGTVKVGGTLSDAITTLAAGANTLLITGNTAAANSIVSITSTSISSGTALDVNINSTAAVSNSQTGIKITTSGANSNSSQTSIGISSTANHTGTFSTNYAGYFIASSGSLLNYGIYADGTTAGVNAISSTGSALIGTSTSGFGISAGSTSSYGGVFSTNPSSTNTIATIVNVIRNTSGVAANGIGGNIRFDIEDDSGFPHLTSELISKWTDAVFATRTSQLTITGVNSGTTQNLLSLDGNGQATLNQYTGTNFNTAQAKVAMVGTDGKVYAVDTTGLFGGGGGGSGLTIGTTAIASGTAGRVLYEGAGNVLQEDGDLTFDGTSLFAKDLKVTGDGTVSYIYLSDPSVTDYWRIGYNDVNGKLFFSHSSNTTIPPFEIVDNNNIDMFGAFSPNYNHFSRSSLSFLNSGEWAVGGTSDAGAYGWQVLTNSYQSGEAQFELQLKPKDISSPSTPASGYGAWYVNNDKAFMKNDGGIIMEMTNTVNNQIVNTTAVGNVGVGEDDLMTYSVPASTLVNNGDYLEFTMTFQFAANANNKQIKVYFGATQLYASTAQAQNDGTLTVVGRIIRTGAATQVASIEVSTDATLFTDVAKYATPAETLSGAIILKATGEATSNNDCTQRILTVQYVRAN